MAFARKTGDKMLVLVYNASLHEAKEKCIRIQRTSAKQLATVFGLETSACLSVYHTILNDEDVSYIKIYLKPLQLGS